MKANKQNLNIFKAVWICFDTNSSDKHQLFFKEHSVRNQEPEYPKNQTLFVLNIPPYITAECLKHAFSKLCGIVRSVTLSNAKGFKTAYIVFEKDTFLDQAMELAQDCVITLTCNKNMCFAGLEKWCKKYNDSLHDEQVTKRKIEEYITEYDKLRISNARQKTAKEDNDGWTIVSSEKKRGQFAPSRKESTIGKVLHKDQQSKKKQLLNFYTFQIREAKKHNLAELRKKFELDKKRLQKLKLKRTFKPF